MKITFFSTRPYDKNFFDETNKKYHFEFNYFDISLNAKTALLAKGSDAICVFVNDQLSREVIEVLREGGVKVILLRCAGFNNVDLKAAQENQILVMRVPSYSPHAVAEHTLAMILTLNRKTHKAYARVREGNFSLDGLLGFDLFGKTVGVIGTGKIGEIFAQIMLGLGTQVLAYDPNPNLALAEKGVAYVSLSELLSVSDIISLHCPLTSETYHLINEGSLKLMKKGVMLVNTGRGGLVDTKAVILGLKEKVMGALALDVYEEEAGLFFENLSDQVIQDDLFARLLSFPNVLITSHQAFFTKEALTAIAETTLFNLDSFQSGHLNKNGVICE